MVAWITAVTGQRREDKQMSPRYILEAVSTPNEELDINYNEMHGTGEEEHVRDALGQTPVWVPWHREDWNGKCLLAGFSFLSTVLERSHSQQRSRERR